MRYVRINLLFLVSALVFSNIGCAQKKQRKSAIKNNVKGTKIIGFGILKNMHDLDKRFEELHVNINSGFSFINDYHFGGYAKKTIELINFMNSFYDHHKIPLDFVYTAKMMFGILDLISKDYFSKGTKILCIHTGGLQGNVSLKEGSLHF